MQEDLIVIKFQAGTKNRYAHQDPGDFDEMTAEWFVGDAINGEEWKNSKECEYALSGVDIVTRVTEFTIEEVQDLKLEELAAMTPRQLGQVISYRHE